MDNNGDHMTQSLLSRGPLCLTVSAASVLTVRDLQLPPQPRGLIMFALVSVEPDWLTGWLAGWLDTQTNDLSTSYTYILSVFWASFGNHSFHSSASKS